MEKFKCMHDMFTNIHKYNGFVCIHSLIYSVDLNKSCDFSRAHTIMLLYLRNRLPFTRQSRTNSHAD